MGRRGSCLCGALSYEIEGDFDGVWMCHCSNCRKTSGGMGNTILIVPRDRFHWRTGEDHRVTYALRPSYTITRCKTCGTPLPAEEDEHNIYVTAGTLDEPLGAGIKNHIFYGSRADWERAADGARYFVERSSGPEVERDPSWNKCGVPRAGDNDGDNDGDADLPIRVDFRDPTTARTWIEDTRIRRPYRPRFFAAFCAALASRPKLRILELGSGPGQLAREILVHCDVQTYVALDFSRAMHEIAAEHLGELAARVTFVTRDFREPAWASELGVFDAVVTLQAAHETRHKRHLVPLLEHARTVLAPGGLLLYADHYLTPETKLPALSPARDDQPLALARAGLVDVELRYEEGNMALWSGTNPVATGAHS